MTREEKIIDAFFDCLCDSLGTSKAVEEITLNYCPDLTDEEILHLLRGRGTRYIVVRKCQHGQRLYATVREIREKE